MSIHPASRRVGLARALSKLGYCSRSQAFALIRGGRVRLNGSLTGSPEAPVRLERDCIEVDGFPVPSAAMIYLMMNKPRGIVTTARDEQGRDTVYSLLPPGLPWIAPVGRLDKASEGLLLLTNDSEWAAKVLDPETHLEKSYHVQIHGHAEEAALNRLVKGVRTHDGERSSAKRATTLRQGSKNAWLEIVLDEGKNRQIRRMLEALNIEVLRLVRVAIGDLNLGELRKGSVRPLSPEEKKQLDERLLGRSPAKVAKSRRQRA
jgi:23S rRNA pseudouridine2605 synthase